MPAVGKVTEETIDGNLVFTDEAGQTWVFPGPSDPPLLLNIDPRIDMTKPIYEQVLRLEARDKAAAARAKSRKRKAAVA